MCQTYQIASSLKFPFAFSALPNLGVGGVHDGDQYVDHEDAHDDLVAQPNDDARGVGEFQGKVFAVRINLNPLASARAVQDAIGNLRDYDGNWRCIGAKLVND